MSASYKEGVQLNKKDMATTVSEESEDKNLPARVPQQGGTINSGEKEDSEIDTRNTFQKLPKRAMAKYGMAGAFFAIFWLWASHANWVEWDNLFRDSMKQLLEKNGPAPVLMVFAIFIVFVAFLGMYLHTVAGKDKEIERLAKMNDRLTERLLGEKPPTTASVGNGKKGKQGK